MTFDAPSFAYSATVAAGGIFGYVKSNSIPSLMAGLLFGGILGYGSYQLSLNPPQYGIFVGASATLAGIMGYRFCVTGKVMPSGAIAALSAIMIIRTIVNRITASPIRVE